MLRECLPVPPTLNNALTRIAERAEGKLRFTEDLPNPSKSRIRRIVVKVRFEIYFQFDSAFHYLVIVRRKDLQKGKIMLSISCELHRPTKKKFSAPLLQIDISI